MVVVSKIKLIPDYFRKTQVFREGSAGTIYTCMHTEVLLEIRKILLKDACWRNEEVVRFVMVIFYVLWEFLSQSLATF